MSKAAAAFIPLFSEGLQHSGSERPSLQLQGKVTTVVNTGQRSVEPQNSLGFLPVWENGKGPGASGACR